MKTGVEIITDERKRQIEVEGWTPEYDDLHTEGELADAAAIYALTKQSRVFLKDSEADYSELIWPFNPEWLKFSPDNRIKELAKAGALIAAEIDRLLRADEYKQS